MSFAAKGSLSKALHSATSHELTDGAFRGARLSATCCLAGSTAMAAMPISSETGRSWTCTRQCATGMVRQQLLQMQWNVQVQAMLSPTASQLLHAGIGAG